MISPHAPITLGEEIMHSQRLERQIDILFIMHSPNLFLMNISAPMPAEGVYKLEPK